MLSRKQMALATTPFIAFGALCATGFLYVQQKVEAIERIEVENAKMIDLEMLDLESVETIGFVKETAASALAIPAEGAFEIGDGVTMVVVGQIGTLGQCGLEVASDARFLTHYRMYNADGEELDSSYKRDKPASFKRTQVIPGFASALTHMCEGDNVRVWVPEDQAYGDRARIGGDIVFDIHLVRIE